MTDLCKAAQQALEALEQFIGKQLTFGQRYTNEGQQMLDAITTLRAALANEALERMAENERELGLSIAEPAKPVAWEMDADGRTIQDSDFTHDVVLRLDGDFESDEQRIAYTQRIVDKLNAPTPRKPEQEPGHPVAWMESPYGVIRANPLYKILAPQTVAWSIPLYPHPPTPRKPLPLTEQDMTRDDTIKLAREAGITFVTEHGVASATPEWLERFAALVAAHEREACAKVCEQAGIAATESYGDGAECIRTAEFCAAAIRSRT